MFTGRCPVVSAVFALILLICSADSVAAASIHVCGNSSVRVEATELVDHKEICNGAGDALAFFERLDLQLTHPLDIVVASNLPEWMRKAAVGCYHQETMTVFVLTFPAFAERGYWFGIPIGPLMHRSLVTHEVAHAVARCNFTISEPTIHAKEYAAYVAMFVMMDPAMRARILMEYPRASFDSELEINEISYSFDPMRFGVAAYRHYLEQANGGDEFLLRVLSGSALIHSVDDLP